MRVSPIIGRAGGAVKTYPEFQAYIAALAVSGTRHWTSVNALAAGKYRTTALALSGTMYGSSWLATFTNDGAISRAIQHGLENEASINAQVAAAREIYFEVEAPANSPSFASLTRNGYTSLAYGGSFSTCRLVRILIWTPEGVFEMNPFAGTGPTPYTW